MRPREVGGFEPDEREQRELTDLWSLSRTALAGTGFDDREHRLRWTVDSFMKLKAGTPNLAYKWVWNWSSDNLGLITRRI